MSDKPSVFRGTHWYKMPNAEEIRLRICATKKSRPNRYWLGKSHSEETKRKISASKKKSTATHRGIAHHNWRGGTEAVTQKIRNSHEYVAWRNAVYKKDGWACRVCGTHKQIVAHHKQSFAENPHLRFDVSNGETLCRLHHIHIHRPEKLRNVTMTHV